MATKKTPASKTAKKAASKTPANRLQPAAKPKRARRNTGGQL